MARINVTSFLAVLLLLGVLANAVPVAHDHDDHSSDALDLNSMTGLQMEDISNQGVQDGLKVRRHAAQEVAARQNAARAAPTPADGPNFAASPEPTPSQQPTPSAQPQKPKGPLANLPIVGGLLGGGLLG